MPVKYVIKWWLIQSAVGNNVLIIVKSAVSQMNCSNIVVTMENFIVNNLNAKLHNFCV